MSLTLNDVQRIARLARIAVNEQEAKGVLDQLGGIFSLIDELKSIDTQGVVPMSHAVDVTQRLREDAVTESDRHREFQAVAPQVEAGLYLVPKVIE